MNERKAYNKLYFERRRRSYAKRAVQAFYYNILTSASDVIPWDVAKGDGKLFLDVGCAHGYGVELFKNLGYESYGVDASNIIAKKRRNRLIIGDAVRLPFKDQSFDLIISVETLEHISNYISALRGMYRTLRSGGVLVLTSPVRNPVNIISDKLHKERHVSVLSPRELHHTLSSVEFSEVFVRAFSFIPMTRFALFGRFFTMRMPRFLARHAMVVAVR